MREFVNPLPSRHAYTCPHCGEFADMTHYSPHSWRLLLGATEVSEVDLFRLTLCARCERIHVWQGDQIVYPCAPIGEAPSDDMPGEARALYVEARNVAVASPAAACALLRQAVASIVSTIEPKGATLVEKVEALVLDGLPMRVRKAMESVRAIGPNAVSPGRIDGSDTDATAKVLFRIAGVLVENRISQVKEVDGMLDMLSGNGNTSTNG